MSPDAAREILLRHARHPVRHGSLADADSSGECRNPLCGDHVVVHLKLNSSREKIQNIGIQVSGCAIATSSASMMTEVIEDTSVENASGLMSLAIETLSAAPHNGTEMWPVALGKIEAFSTLGKNPRKIPCALMAWFALKDALSGLRETSS